MGVFFSFEKKSNFSFKYLPKHTWKVINSKQIKSTFLIYLFFITRGVYLFVFSLKSNYFSKCSILLRVCVFLKSRFSIIPRLICDQLFFFSRVKVSYNIYVCVMFISFNNSVLLPRCFYNRLPFHPVHLRKLQSISK